MIVTNRARAEAYKTLDLVHSAPVEAGRRALLLIDDSDQEASAVARWVVGRSAYERADYVAARVSLGHALRRSRGLDDVEAQIRVSLAALDLEVGHTASAMRQLGRAADVVSERFAGRVLQQRSFVLFQLGRAREAVEVADLAFPLLGRDEDAIFQARLLINRGIAYLALDDLARAEVDFIACRAVAVDAGQVFIVAAADHNLGFLAGRRGDIAGALHLYEQARDAYRELGDPGRVMPILEADMSETLLTAGLLEIGRAHV